MQVQAINRRAQERYGTFVSAMDLVLDALDGLNALIDKVDDRTVTDGWTVATKEELQGYRRQAFDELERLRTVAKKYEIELVSREWRL
jgi:hypothetical protein